MTPDRFQQIEELYHAARERDAKGRAAMLAKADPDVRREVESLLAQPGAEFLDRPAIQKTPQLLGDATVTDYYLFARSSEGLQHWNEGELIRRECRG
ncbi:MAG TPA: hypothetical protein VIX91_21820 [Candidatus Acidoferrum sp.]